MNKKHTFPNGAEVEFKDCIHHTTTTKFPVIQRIRHLFGAPVVIESKIHCENEVGYTLDEGRGVHTRIFKRKKRYKSSEMLCRRGV